MLTKKMQEALCAQVDAEHYASYLYLAMSAHFHSINLRGFAHWMRVQAQEELTHALKIFDYIIERGGRVTLGQIKAPPVEWESPLAAFEAAAEHERKVTGLIDNLANQALREHDHATGVFLQWFVTEQVEEEASVGDVVYKLSMIQNAPGGLFMLDRDLAARGP